jgi:hypothetical protein
MTIYAYLHYPVCPTLWSRTKWLWCPSLPYSLYLAPCNFLLLKTKLKLKGKAFNNVLEIQQHSKKVLNSATKEEFQSSNDGRTTRFCALTTHKGSILKGT